MTLRGLVPRPGRYVIVVHFYQPAHPTFPAQVSVHGGRLQSGELWGARRVWGFTCPGRGVTGLPPFPPGIFRASFCPHVLGCQVQVIARDHVEFDISEPEVALTVTIPEGKSLVLVRSAFSSLALHVLTLVSCSMCLFWLMRVIPPGN